MESWSKNEKSQEKLAAGAGDQKDIGLHDLKSRAHKAFQDNHILMDYKPQGGRFQEDGPFEGAGTRGRKSLLKDRDGDRIRGRKILLKDRHNNGTQGRRTLLQGRDNDGAQGGTTLLKDQDKQESSMVNQQLPDFPPAERAGGESGNKGLMLVEGLDLGLDEALQEDEELLLLASHPRVLFTTSPTPPKHPPLQLQLELDFLTGDEEDEEQEDEEQTSNDVSRTQPGNADEPSQARDGESYRNLLLGLSAGPVPSQIPHNVARRRRQVGLESRKRAVCESVSVWTNRKTAIDIRMRNVTVVDYFETKKGRISQIFYETSCREPGGKVSPGEHGVAGGACLGVDKKYWVSECQTKHTFVKAFTEDSNGRTSWNWIRIDSSCVCVLQDKKHKLGRGTR